MSIEKKISELIKDAMKSGDKPRLQALRSVKSALMTERTRHSGEMNDADEQKLIGSHRKKMDGALQQYKDAGREDLVPQVTLEIEVCDELLPARLTVEEVAEIVKSKIAAVNATSPQDMGKVMGPVMKELAGRADGNDVRKLVIELLGK